MTLAALKKEADEKLTARDYHGLFKLIDRASEDYLNAKHQDYTLCIELISQNQDLYEYMGASKQFESAFELINKLMQNRNQLFISCLNKNQSELKLLFKRAVGA